MFMRYTHLGVGHPAILQNIIKDCLKFKSPGATIVSNSNEADMDYEGNSDEECYTGCGDAEEEESDEDISNDEMEDEDSDKGNLKDNGKGDSLWDFLLKVV
ncbi:hypothetical protein DFH29DRAFT_877166 [Suillus ampliporus]|nr:hypothetical protein DFH29DRAFT_877166 [Suillus ampliporus]